MFLRIVDQKMTSHHSPLQPLQWLPTALGLKWQFQGLAVTCTFYLYPNPRPLGHSVTGLRPRCVSLFLKHSTHLYLQVEPVRDFLFLERFPDSSWHAWLFPHNHFSTQKPSLTAPILLHRQQADSLGHIITFICFTALFESTDLYISLLSDSFPRKSTYHFGNIFHLFCPIFSSRMQILWELGSFIYVISHSQLQCPF